MSVAILTQLEQNAFTTDELVRLTGHPEGQVKARLFGLIRSGRVTVNRDVTPPRYELVREPSVLKDTLMAVAGA